MTQQSSSEINTSFPHAVGHGIYQSNRNSGRAGVFGLLVLEEIQSVMAGKAWQQELRAGLVIRMLTQCGIPLCML